jgi:hypothetical protein
VAPSEILDLLLRLALEAVVTTAEVALSVLPLAVSGEGEGESDGARARDEVEDVALRMRRISSGTRERHRVKQMVLTGRYLGRYFCRYSQVHLFSTSGKVRRARKAEFRRARKAKRQKVERERRVRELDGHHRSPGPKGWDYSRGHSASDGVAGVGGSPGEEERTARD